MEWVARSAFVRFDGQHQTYAGLWNYERVVMGIGPNSSLKLALLRTRDMEFHETSVSDYLQKMRDQ